jgi:hypothetical protein
VVRVEAANERECEGGQQDVTDEAGEHEHHQQLERALEVELVEKQADEEHEHTDESQDDSHDGAPFLIVGEGSIFIWIHVKSADFNSSESITQLPEVFPTFTQQIYIYIPFSLYYSNCKIKWVNG